MINTSCRSCGSSQLEEVVNLGDMYLNEFRHDSVLPPISPLTLDLCEVCFLVQLGTSVDPNLIYTDDYGFESGVNNTVRADLADIVLKTIRKIGGLNIDDVVIDIGCNDGTLLSNYSKDLFRIGFDPVEKYMEKSQVFADVIYDTFFSSSLFDDPIKAKIITSISMFYDLDDPNKFCDDIYSSLDDEGIWVVQQNYLYSMLRQNAYDNIVHQHVEYYSLHSMNDLLRRHGFRIFSVEENNVNGGSFRTYICKDEASFVTDPTVEELFEKEKKDNLTDVGTYTNFALRIESLKDELYDTIYNLKQDGKSTYIYGASTRGDTLLQYSRLDSELTPFAVERNPSKFGKVISSLQIPIISEEQAREEKPDYMLVLPWFFFDEFKHRESDYLVGGGKFIVPLPEVIIHGRFV